MTQAESQLLDEIHELSKRMLSVAKTQQWQDLQAMEQQRKRIIDQFFAHPVASKDADRVAFIIKQIITINQQITSELEQKKVQLGVDFKQFNSSRKASNAYLDNSR